MKFKSILIFYQINYPYYYYYCILIMNFYF